MIGSTRSSTKRRTLSRTARSSSESSESMLKKSCMARNLGGDETTREGRDSDGTRLGSERGTVIDGEAALILPLVHHLVQQRLERLRPAVASQMPPADGDLGRVAGPGRGGVVAQP